MKNKDQAHQVFNSIHSLCFKDMDRSDFFYQFSPESSHDLTLYSKAYCQVLYYCYPSVTLVHFMSDNLGKFQSSTLRYLRKVRGNVAMVSVIK